MTLRLLPAVENGCHLRSLHCHRHKRSGRYTFFRMPRDENFPSNDKKFHSHLSSESLELAVGRWSEGVTNNNRFSQGSTLDDYPTNIYEDYSEENKASELNTVNTEDSNQKGKSQKDSQYRTALVAFLLVSLISALLIMALEGFMFGALTIHRNRFTSQLRYFEMSIFLSLFIFAAVYQCVITVIGLLTKNMLLLAMLCLFYVCMLIYTGVQYQEITRRVNLVGDRRWDQAIFATNVTTIVVISITLISQFLLIYFVLWRGVQWFRFKKIGASFEIKRLYSYFQIHRSLLLFDFFFFLGFTIQFIVIMIADKTSTEFILTCVMLPLTVLVLGASDFAATREWLWLTICTTLCFLAGMAYVLFKIIRLYTKYSSAYNIAVVPGEYFPGRSSLVSFGVITLIFLLATLVMEGMMMFNFNKGLLPYVRNYFTSKGSKKFEGVSPTFAENDSIMID